MIYKKDVNFPYPLLTNTSNSYDGCNFILDVNLDENTNNDRFQINYEIGSRRAGDLPIFFADSTKAKEELGWVATKTLEDMCRDSWNYVIKNVT